MTIFKKAQTATQPQQPSKIRELSAADLQAVSGGLNPQPLPPRWLRFSNF